MSEGEIFIVSIMIGIAIFIFGLMVCDWMNGKRHKGKALPIPSDDQLLIVALISLLTGTVSFIVLLTNW